MSPSPRQPSTTRPPGIDRHGHAGARRGPTALVTGASRGLGRALARELAQRGWQLVLDARSPEDLALVADELESTTRVIAIAGDVTDPDHRAELARAVAGLGQLDLLVNNASRLGPSPLPRLAELDPDDLVGILATNVVAPLAVFQAVAGHLAPGATVIDISSDAAVETYEGWGGYGASKAALDHLGAVLAVEHPELHVHTVDPGDMRTAMHQAAFPGEDISNRADPATVAPTLVALVAAGLPSGRRRVTDLAASLEVAAGGAGTESPA